MTQTVHYRLIVRRGPQPNQVFELTADSIMLGRDIINDITIGDPEVSRQHCKFEKLPEGGYTIEDLGSTNGSFINGTKLSGKHNLHNGDKISFGETVHVDYAVTAISVPVSSSALLDETRPMDPEALQVATAATGLTPVQAKAEAPAAYVYTPAASVETTPEAKRMSLFACGILTTFCVITAFMGIILIDAADRWQDLPLIGSWFETTTVKLNDYETSRFEVGVPENWEMGVVDFADIVVLTTSDEKIAIQGIVVPLNAQTVGVLPPFEQNRSAQIIAFEGADNLGSVLAGMETQLFENGAVASEIVERDQSDTKIDGADAIWVDYELKRPPSSESATHVKLVVVTKSDWTIVFVGMTTDENPKHDFAIFTDMIESIKIRD